MTAALEIGDRFEIADYAVPKVRPRGTRTGLIVRDAGDCWMVRFDGNKNARLIFKAYIQRERVKAAA